MRTVLLLLSIMSFASAQPPPIEPGVSHELAKWRAARYSDVRYKLNLTLEKMSPVLKGTIEVRVVLRDEGSGGRGDAVIILDWRKIRGHEEKSTISNVSINGKELKNHPVGEAPTPLLRKEGSPEERPLAFSEDNEHLIFRDGVIAGENVIKLDFTSPILTSGSAITRYVDKEDGAEYIYSLFVPSDASTAFPVFDQPDLKARFTLSIKTPPDWAAIANNRSKRWANADVSGGITGENRSNGFSFGETKPISTYVFAFAAGPWQQVSEPGAVATGSPDLGSGISDRGLAVTQSSNPQSAIRNPKSGNPVATAPGSDSRGHVFVRKSQLAKFQPHAAEVFRLNREGIRFLETYFDYKFPFPKYDLVLIPEFPFGGMEHAGATFLREDRVIFPQEPTKNDYITRANLIFHEAAHQWFGDTVTMRWFDDLWLKEGFAEFMAYKTLEKVMPEYNAWKVFYERNKQAAYLTDSTKGTTPIYQEIANLSAAKSAYGNIVYRKAPSFLKQAEFYIGADKFQTAVRVFLKKHEFANAGWEDLVTEFEGASAQKLDEWAKRWVTQRGMSIVVVMRSDAGSRSCFDQINSLGDRAGWSQRIQIINGLGVDRKISELELDARVVNSGRTFSLNSPMRLGASVAVCDRTTLDWNRVDFVFPNYQDHGYGIFLLDDKSRDYVLKNIQNEKDDFLRSMMWGSLWDSVREGELDPKDYVELVLKSLSTTPSAEAAATPPIREGSPTRPSKGGTSNEREDETTVATLLNRVSTAMTYYLAEKQRDAIAPRLEAMLIEKMQNAPTLGQRLTYYRALLNVASTANARGVLKRLLHETLPPAVAGGSTGGNPSGSEGANPKSKIKNPGDTLPTGRVSASRTNLPLKTKDRFDIVTRLLILGDPDGPRLLAELEKTETSDEAKRYAYAARAGIATKENKAKYWSDFTANKEISESWIEAAFGPFNSVRHADLTLPYLDRALKELPNHKRNRKIFFVNGWLGAFIGGQRSEEALAVVNKFLADNPNLDRDLRLKILENVDLIERAVKIRTKFGM